MSAEDGVGRTLLYVEAIYDKDHWKRILNKLGFSEYFEVTTYGQHSGKASLLKLYAKGKLNESQMIAIDADLDRLIDFDIEKFNSPFVFDTYVYSIEGIILDKDVVGKLIGLLKQMYDYLDFDFDSFMISYAARCYQELSKIIDSISGQKPSDLIDYFRSCDLSLCDSIDRFLTGDDNAIFNVSDIDHADFVCETLQNKGVEIEESYRYIRGHALRRTLDCLLKKLKTSIERFEIDIIRSNFSGEGPRISEEISRMRSLLENNYSLDTFLMAKEIPENNIGVVYLSNKVKKTVENHLLH